MIYRVCLKEKISNRRAKKRISTNCMYLFYNQTKYWFVIIFSRLFKMHQESFRNENHLNLISVSNEHHNYFVMNFDLSWKEMLTKKKYTIFVWDSQFWEWVYIFSNEENNKFFLKLNSLNPPFEIKLDKNASKFYRWLFWYTPKNVLKTNIHFI